MEYLQKFVDLGFGGVRQQTSEITSTAVYLKINLLRLLYTWLFAIIYYPQ